jgi:hypothetical protein
LPAKFSDAECEAYCHLQDCGVRGWLVDMVNKSVVFIDDDDKQHRFASLVQFASERASTC